MCFGHFLCNQFDCFHPQAPVFSWVSAQQSYIRYAQQRVHAAEESWSITASATHLAHEN